MRPLTLTFVLLASLGSLESKVFIGDCSYLGFCQQKCRVVNELRNLIECYCTRGFQLKSDGRRCEPGQEDTEFSGDEENIDGPEISGDNCDDDDGNCDDVSGDDKIKECRMVEVKEGNDVILKRVCETVDENGDIITVTKNVIMTSVFAKSISVTASSSSQKVLVKMSSVPTSEISIRKSPVESSSSAMTSSLIKPTKMTELTKMQSTTLHESIKILDINSSSVISAVESSSATSFTVSTFTSMGRVFTTSYAVKTSQQSVVKTTALSLEATTMQTSVVGKENVLSTTTVKIVSDIGTTSIDYKLTATLNKVEFSSTIVPTKSSTIVEITPKSSVFTIDNNIPEYTRKPPTVVDINNNEILEPSDEVSPNSVEERNPNSACTLNLSFTLLVVWYSFCVLIT